MKNLQTNPQVDKEKNGKNHKSIVWLFLSFFSEIVMLSMPTILYLLLINQHMRSFYKHIKELSNKCKTQENDTNR